VPEATITDVLEIARKSAVFTCVKCGTKGSGSEVFHVVEIGDKDRPNAAIPVKAGKIIVRAWTCKHCPEDE
jgi:hypothetical protein